MRSAPTAATLVINTHCPVPPGRWNMQKGLIMPTWLIILLVGVVLLILGVAVEAAQFLIWIAVIVLVISLIMGFVGRGRARL